MGIDIVKWVKKHQEYLLSAGANSELLSKFLENPSMNSYYIIIAEMKRMTLDAYYWYVNANIFIP